MSRVHWPWAPLSLALSGTAILLCAARPGTTVARAPREVSFPTTELVADLPRAPELFEPEPEPLHEETWEEAGRRLAQEAESLGAEIAAYEERRAVIDLVSRARSQVRVEVRNPDDPAPCHPDGRGAKSG